VIAFVTSESRPQWPIRKLIRWSLIAVYAGVCSLMALATIYALVPEKVEWSLEEAPASYLAHPEGSDHWRWSPAPGKTLTALARADASVEKRFVPDIVSKRRVRVYIQMRVPEVSDQIAAAVKEDPSRLVACSFLAKDGPRPVWWKPTHQIDIDFEGRRETFYFRPEEPEKIHYIRDDVFTN
jgi:hypothetical protein